MKKLQHLIFVMLLLTCSLGYASGADKTPVKEPVTSLTVQQQLRLQVISRRLTEIKAIDKSKLSRADKKALKVELRGLKKEARGMAAGGVFLTVGSLLAVIVLLILLL
jgi:hypothetical protein